MGHSDIVEFELSKTDKKYTIIVNNIFAEARAIPIRAAFWALVGTGLIAAGAGGIAANQLNSSAAFKCALAATVNFVAAGHYHMIGRVREQRLYSEYAEVAFKMGKRSTWSPDGASEALLSTVDDKAKIFVQEFMVDAMRHSDWLITVSNLCQPVPNACFDCWFVRSSLCSTTTCTILLRNALHQTMTSG